MDDNKEKENSIAIESPQNKNNDINISKSPQKHQIMMNIANIEMDMTIFDNIHSSNDFGKCESENCNSLNRILTASLYYSKLNIIENSNHYHLFNDFVYNIYVDLPNDYIHFNNQHT
eukprot:125142_1